MTRKKYTTTLSEDLLERTKRYALSQNFAGANVIIEEALVFYFQNHNVEVWERRINSKEHCRVTLQENTTCIDYIHKRIIVNTQSDTNKLKEEGYLLRFPKQ